MYRGLDCEMVGVGRQNFLAHVCVVDQDGAVIYNEHVRLPEHINPDAVNYRTQWSGVTKNNLAAATRSFTRVQSDVKELLTGAIVVGHALENDFKALRLDPRAYTIKDTAHAAIFKEYKNGRLQLQSLKKLAATLLGKEIQKNTHDPAEDARTAMELFLKYKPVFDLSDAQVLSDMKVFLEAEAPKV